MKQKPKLMPPTYFFILLAAAIILHFVFPIYNLIYSSIKFLGWLLIFFGIILNIWADSIFKKDKTTVKPHLKPSKFVIKGPFKISRHPMYLGMLGILLGFALVLGSLISFLSPIIFVWLMEKQFIPIEEKNMEKAFGKKYLNYKKRVRRWI